MIKQHKLGDLKQSEFVLAILEAGVLIKVTALPCPL